MESCTGGNLANILTDAPGASAYFRASYVTYTNDMKIAMGVPADIIEKYGAVSGECAIAMADAARERSGATVGVGITGVAGPGELEGKPAGLAYIGISDERNHKMREGQIPRPTPRFQAPRNPHRHVRTPRLGIGATIAAPPPRCHSERSEESKTSNALSGSTTPPPQLVVTKPTDST